MKKVIISVQAMSVMVDFENLEVVDVEGKMLVPHGQFRTKKIANIIREELKVYMTSIKDAKRQLDKWNTGNEFDQYKALTGTTHAEVCYQNKRFISEFESQHVYEIVASIVLEKYFKMDAIDRVKAEIGYHDAYKRYLNAFSA